MRICILCETVGCIAVPYSARIVSLHLHACLELRTYLVLVTVYGSLCLLAHTIAASIDACPAAWSTLSSF